MGNIQKFKQWLSEPVDGNVLGLFRWVFGLFMAYEAWVYYSMGLIEQGFFAPKILFKFEGFDWVHLLPQPAMVAVLAIMGVSALLVALGVFFRASCWVLALSYTFIFLQEKSYYNNHIYLFILLSVLLSTTDAHRFLVPFRWKGVRLPTITHLPRWQPFMFQFMVMIVYFYGGLTKLKGDWLFRREPIHTMLDIMPASHWMAPLIKNDAAVYILTYGGLLLDLLAPLLLWYKPIRRWALIPFIGFHLTNSQMFNDIGIFPFVMLGALFLYFETQEMPWFQRLLGKQAQPVGPVVLPVTPQWVRQTLVMFFVLQLLLPFRGFFLPNDMDWTGIGKNFAWRMKVDTRPLEEFEFTVRHPQTGQVFPVHENTYVNPSQLLLLGNDVRAIAAFARFIREEAAQQGVPDGIVNARVVVRYNGRPPQLLVRSDVDLASVSYSPFQKLDWVVPLNN